MIKHFSLRFSLFLVVLDAALVVMGLLIATGLRILIPLGVPAVVEARYLPLPVYVVAVVIYYATFAQMEVHRPRQAVTLGREIRVAVAAALVAWLVFLGALYLTFRDVSRLQIIYFLGVHLGLLVLSRTALRLAYVARGRRRISVRRVLVIGENDIATQITNLIATHRFSGLAVAEVVTPDEAETRLEDLVRGHDIAEVVIALERNTTADLPGLVRRLQALPVNIRLIPQYTDLAFLQVQFENFSGVPLMTLKEPVLSPSQRATKRIFDLLIAVPLLVVAAPLMALIWVLVRLDSPGPALFRQQRMGEGGMLFEMLKFRSMVQGAQFQQELVRQYDERGKAIYKDPEDPRITRLGSLLRVSSMDELPQLWNIVRGDMSLIGPRPELPELVEKYEPWQRKRFEVPQGLTGWWQVNGRANKPMHLNTEDDLYYIRNYSLLLDLKILWRTVWVVLARRGAF